MSESRLPDYLDHMQQAAADACGFVEGLDKDNFLKDKRTQQAVIMSLIIIGEAATKVMDGYEELVQGHADAQPHCPRLFRHQPRGGVGHGAIGAASAAQATAHRARGCRRGCSPRTGRPGERQAAVIAPGRRARLARNAHHSAKSDAATIWAMSCHVTTVTSLHLKMRRCASVPRRQNSRALA